MLDVFSRCVVGWSIDSRPLASLATNALAMAINNRQPDGSIIHSDHGTQPKFKGSSQHGVVGRSVDAR